MGFVFSLLIPETCSPTSPSFDNTCPMFAYVTAGSSLLCMN